MYSGRQPASTALMATFSATTTVFRPEISPRISSPRIPAPASISPTDFSVGGTTGKPSVQPRSKYASIRPAGSSIRSPAALLDLGPRVAQPDGAVEDRASRRRLPQVDAEVALALELEDRAGRHTGQRRLQTRAAYDLERARVED